MTPPKRVRLTRDNQLIGGHVYMAGDVVEVHADRTKDMVLFHAGVIVSPDEPVTQPGKPRPRSEVIAEQAALQAPAQAERAVRRPKVAAAV